MAQIASGTGSGDKATVDVNKAMYGRLRDSAGADVARINKSAINQATIQGFPIVGADSNLARSIRAMSDGALADARPALYMFDPVEGAAVNTNTWTQVTTTMTITQAAGVVTFNAGSSFASTVGALHIGQKLIPFPGRSRVLFRSRQRHTAHFTNNLMEFGFSTAAVATTSMVAGGYSGFIWRKDGTGQYLPVICVAGSEALGTPIENSTFTAAVGVTDYANFEVEVDDLGAWFRILTVAGVLVNEQRLNFAATVADLTVTHLTPSIRIYNSGATGTAVQMLVGETTVYLLDVDTNRPWSHVCSGLGYSHHQSPTAYTQTANYTNVTAPTTRTPTNIAALEPTLGGQISWNNAGTSFAANEGAGSDLQIFGYQIPTPYAFVLTGLRISTVNLGAANGAAAYTILYSLAVNSSAVSLATAAPNAPRFIPLGFQSLAATAPIGTVFSPDITWVPGTPITIMPGRFIHLVARVIGASAATASQVIRTIWTPDGYFE